MLEAVPQHIEGQLCGVELQWKGANDCDSEVFAAAWRESGHGAFLSSSTTDERTNIDSTG